MIRTYPPSGRVIAGFSLASAAAAAPTILLGSFAVIAFPIGFVLAAAHAFLLGGPIYLMLRRRYEVGFLNSAVLGFLIGALPFAFFTLAMEGPRTAGPQSWAVFNALMPSPIFGALGAIGGLAFRAMIGRNEGMPDYAATFG